MKFSTYRVDGETYYGAAVDGGMIPLNDAFPEWPTLRNVIDAGGLDQLEQAVDRRVVTHTDFTYLPPLTNPGRIICVGVNFPDRNSEYKDGSGAPKYMSLFPRFISGFVGHGENLVRPPESHTLDYEGEVAVFIGKSGRRINKTDAYDHIAGLSICNEGTIRDWVRHAKFNVTQGKNWDRSAAMGPWLVPFKDASQIEDARIVTRVNGEERQNDTLDRMVFSVKDEIAYISTFMALHPGDIIISGTPTGAGARLDPPQYLKPGDNVTVEVTGIGMLQNGIEDEVV